MRAWQVETQCPQCGAPITLREAQHILSCQYCKTRLYLTSRGPFRYTIPRRRQGEDTVFIPFWRVRGLGFTAYLPPKTQGKPLDKTLMAIDLPLRLYTLGLRPQVSRLTFADLHQGTFLRPRIGFKHLLERAEKQAAAPVMEKTRVKRETNLFLSGLGKNAPFNNSDFSSWNPSETQTVFKKYEPVFSAFLDDGVSLIYFPVIPEAGKVVSLKDGLTGKLLGRVPEADWEKITARRATVIPPVGTLPLLCPNCGWDLKCEDESWAALCPGCGRLWGVSQGKYVPIPFEIVPSRDPDPLYLPFWKMETAIPELGLHTAGDLMKFYNQPGPGTPDSHAPLFTCLPAFKVQPRLFLQICRVFTLAQPRGQSSDKIPGDAYPVILPPQKVRKLIPVVMAEIGAAKTGFFSKLPKINPGIKAVSLIFLPFRKGGYEVSFSGALTFAIPRNALKWGKRL